MDSNTDDEKHVVAAAATNENANANSRPINWTSIVTDDKGPDDKSCQRLSDFRGKSESSKLKMNLGESLQCKSSSSNSSNAANGNGSGNGVETSSPLDFSMKKRKLILDNDQKLFGGNNNGSAFETVISNNLIAPGAKPLTYANLLMGQSQNSSASPFLLNPSMFPLSLAAAASVHQNFGSVTAATAAANQQHLLTSSSSAMVDMNNRKSSLGPSSLNGGGNGSLLAQHLASSQPSPQHAPMVKNQRPFKAYDPLKPGSALNINSFLPPTNLASASPLLNTGVNQQIFSDQLLAQYCQYLISAQTIASINKQKTADDVQRQIDCRNLNFSIKSNNNNNCHRSNGGDSTTVSPPQVTSTSHPHVDSSTPPASSGLDSSSSSVSVGNGAESICNGDGDNDIDKSESNDMRDSTSPLIIENCASRRRGKSLPEELKDEAYWERRRKNNEAAKRSRDLRRAKEDEIAIRAALLEQENSRLRVEVAALKAETEKLRQMLLNS